MSLSRPTNRFLALPLLVCATLLYAACVAQTLPIGASDESNGSPPASNRSLAFPRPPTAHPDSTGGAVDFVLLNSIEEAFECLERAQPVFAVLQSNANVRNRPDRSGCRLGRAPAGTLVRVEAIFGQERERPFVALDRTVGRVPFTTPSYDDDIQPLFEESCGACHSSSAKLAELQVTAYEPLMAGGQSGPAVAPGDPDASRLWQQIRSGAMPLVGELGDDEKALIYDWIAAGAAAQAEEPAPPAEMWLNLSGDDFTWAPNSCADDGGTEPFLNAQLVRAASCSFRPDAEQIVAYLPKVDPPPAARAASVPAQNPPSDQPANQAAAGTRPAAPPPAAFNSAGIVAAPLNLGPPSESDPWLVPRGGFCAQQFLADELQNRHSITALAFAPDGRLFLALDAPATGDFDPAVLYDPYNTSRAVTVWHSNTKDSYYQILGDSSRITGLAWHAGAVYLNRAGEVGRITDGGSYEPLAGGFAVAGRLFHANNGIVITNGWVYVSAGGVRDGYSDGVIVLGDGDLPAETLATNVAAGGNPYAARIVRARLDRLLAERSISVFHTAARGVRNPYGIATDPRGRIWFTDNGATNVPGDFNAGDEVDLLDPRTLSPAANAGDVNATPFYGFPLTLGGLSKDWWAHPVLTLPNSAAPTAITWAYNTIFFALYGRDPGLYRLANANGAIIAERIMHNWPVQAVATAPDGAVWIGTGTGGLYRLAPGCGG